MKAKNGIMILSLLFICVSVHAAFLEPASAATINVQNASYYSGGTLSLNEQIQAILDSASAGDTINFLGQLYEDLQLTVSKKLNIITSAGTKLIGSSSGSAVFLINGSDASGTQISGFNITGSGSGILVNNTSNVSISNDNISAANGQAVAVNGSSNTNIKNSLIYGSSNGIEVSNSKNTRITGSTIKNNKHNGVNIENSVNTTMNQDQILNNAERGVRIYNSNNTVINGSTLRGNGNNNTAGISSDDGAVSVKNSKGVKITRNQITRNSQGITTIDSSSVTINNNTINDNYGEGILLNGTLLNDVSITNNYIKGNCNGIEINYKTGKNINISSNTITGSVDRILDEDSGIGLSFGPSYASNSGTETIEHNAILNNGNMDIRAKDAQVRPKIGSNWYGNKPSLCWCVDYAAAVYMVIAKIGKNKYAVQFYDGATNKIAANLPSIMVKFIAGGVSQISWTSNGEAIFQVDSNLGAGTLTATADNVEAYIDRIIEDPAGNSENDHDSVDDPNGGPGGPGGPGSDLGGYGGTSSSGGVASGISSSVGITSTAAAAGSAGSNGQNEKNGGTKTTQELFIEDTVKNPQIWGIIGIIILIIMVFVAYYRNDLMKMIKKSKK